VIAGSARIATNVLAMMALMAFAACSGEQKPRSPAVAAPDTVHHDRNVAASPDTLRRDSIFREKLPAGRYQLPTAHTPAPDLWITLPAGYTVRSVGRMPDDEFFIFRSDDPTLHDTAAVTPGFMRVYVGVMPQTGVESGDHPTEENVLIGGEPLVWRLWSERTPDGKRYYQREIKSGDFFAGISPELAKAPLHLHIYVAGKDSAAVAALMRAARTISLRP
jgi:hypothetical protein